MKLEIGMYVRTTGDAYEPSKIGKIKEVDITSFKEVCYRIDSCGKHILIPESFIKKYSYNLIDLVEVGDIVKVCDCFNGHIDEIYIIDDKDGSNSLETLKAIIDKSGYEIKETLTHEQYEANCYKVGE